MDYAATTPVKKEVVEAMVPYFTETFGNASSPHGFGRDAKKTLIKCRDTVAKTLNAKSDEIYFTAGGTESDNWAINGVVKFIKPKGNHIITTAIEHHAVLHAAEALEKEGYDVTYLPVDKDGLISLEDLKAAIKDETCLISVMFINNEIGTIQPIKEIGEIAKAHNIIFHTDAVQAYGNVAIDVEELNIDLLSISSHKIYGPKGVGALYMRKGTKIGNFIVGGAQERKRRAGTENIPGIVGFTKAAELAHENLEAHIEKLTGLRDRLITGLLEKIDYSRLNGHASLRHPGNVNISFEFIEGEALLLMLDHKGVAGSSGSACTSGSLDPSHVLMGIGLKHEIAHGSLRLSLGDFTTEEDVDYAIEVLMPIVQRLREMSPLYPANN
jgi:cysteine desulfurase